MNSTILEWDVIDSPIGALLVAATESGTCSIAWDVDDPEERAADLAERIAAVPRRSQSGSVSVTVGQLEEWFNGQRKEFDLALQPDPRQGDRFAARVLAVTAAIPRGTTLTYGEVAAAAGSPGGSRAAGNALGANPIPIVIPCHRVIAAGGRLGGFGGGPERKLKLLEIEGAARPR
jgi:methylated-DNA-[protein]-cysteine S-methyltransferase